MDINGFLIAFVAVIPSGITGFLFWLLEKKIEKRNKLEDERREKLQAKADEREKARQKNELLTIQAVGASIMLGEATARAVQRIPDAHCNGDMEAALSYAAKIKHDQRDFLYTAGVTGIYGEVGA